GRRGGAGGAAGRGREGWEGGLPETRKKERARHGGGMPSPPERSAATSDGGGGEGGDQVRRLSQALRPHCMQASCQSNFGHFESFGPFGGRALSELHFRTEKRLSALQFSEDLQPLPLSPQGGGRDAQLPGRGGHVASVPLERGPD